MSWEREKLSASDVGRKTKVRMALNRGIQRSFMFVGRKQLAQCCGSGTRVPSVWRSGCLPKLNKKTRLMCPKVPNMTFPCFRPSSEWENTPKPANTINASSIIHPPTIHYPGCIIIRHDEAKACCFCYLLSFFIYLRGQVNIKANRSLSSNSWAFLIAFKLIQARTGVSVAKHRQYNELTKQLRIMKPTPLQWC